MSEAPAAPPAGADDVEALRQGVIEALQTVYDPEIPVNIFELGLIYNVAIEPAGKVAIEMTLTAPGCPVAGTMPAMVQEAVGAVAGVREATVELVWDPPWDQSMMSDVARLELGMI